MSKPIDRQSTLCIVMILLSLLFCPSSIIFSAEKGADKEEMKNNVFNIYDTERGRVSKDGAVYNLHGRMLGSVDGEGIIYNISKIKIGRVEADGSILNQSDTKLGTVNEKGEIFNVSQRKIGQVKDINDIKLIGGAARLIFF
jgi:hypothetical protein